MGLLPSSRLSAAQMVDEKDNAAAKAQSEAGAAFALFAKGVTALLCRSWALC